MDILFPGTGNLIWGGYQNKKKKNIREKKKSK